MDFSQVNLPSNKKFGFFFSIIFLIFCIYFFYLSKNYLAGIFLFLTILIFLITFFNPNLLSIFNRLWMTIGIKLGNIINPIILFLIYFSLFASYGIIMKILKRDELRIKLNKKLSSFWRVRKETKNFTNFNNQF